MYGLVLNHKIIGIHENKDVIKKFKRNFDNEDSYIIKLKKKIRKNKSYYDLFLVRYKDLYIPYELYETFKDTEENRLYDLIYVKDILFRLMEEYSLSDKENKSISKVISIIIKLIEKPEDIDFSTIKNIKELNDEYKYRIMEE